MPHRVGQRYNELSSGRDGRIRFRRGVQCGRFAHELIGAAVLSPQVRERRSEGEELFQDVVAPSFAGSLRSAFNEACRLLEMFHVAADQAVQVPRRHRRRPQPAALFLPAQSESPTIQS